MSDLNSLPRVQLDTHRAAWRQHPREVRDQAVDGGEPILPGDQRQLRFGVQIPVFGQLVWCQIRKIGEDEITIAAAPGQQIAVDE